MTPPPHLFKYFQSLFCNVVHAADGGDGREIPGADPPAAGAGQAAGGTEGESSGGVTRHRKQG